MDLENFSDIDKKNLPKLKQYWKYLQTYRAQIDEEKLVSSDIANIFTSPMEPEK